MPFLYQISCTVFIHLVPIVLHTCRWHYGDQPPCCHSQRLEIGFFDGGQGNIIACPEGEVHGVVMEFGTEEDWDKTKENEKGYLTKNIQVFPYNSNDDTCSKNDSVEATVFIMAMGLEHHGGTKVYIEMLRNQTNIPSTNPSNYGRFPGDDADTQHGVCRIPKLRQDKESMFFGWRIGSGDYRAYC